MDMSWINPTIIISLLALFIAWHNYRRNNFTMIRVLGCERGYVTDIREQGGKGYFRFGIKLQNLGVPLNNLSMRVGFCGPNGLGWGSTSLYTMEGLPQRAGQFGKGMITEFGLKSYQLPPGDDAFLASLADTKKQRAGLFLYADGYEVWEYQFDSRVARLKRRWNAVADWLNTRLRYTIRRDGDPLIRESYYFRLRTFEDPHFAFMEFVGRFRQRKQSGPTEVVDVIILDPNPARSASRSTG